MIPHFLLFTILPRACFSDTLYNQRFGLTNISFINETSENCQLPRLNFSFYTIYNFTLNNCKINKCYAIIDDTSDMKWGNPGLITPSVFATVNIEGARYMHKTAGIIFRPERSTIYLNLQTQTCHDFFTIHPFENSEDCNQIFNFRDLVHGLPFCRDLS